MSWVFLTDQFAYKLKKPVKTSFLDFSTVALRKHFCEEEMRLNLRLAPRVYLGTVAITRADGGMSIAGEAPAIDWCQDAPAATGSDARSGDPEPHVH
jgi:aminoglycoside phosphotransferase family enzyme